MLTSEQANTAHAIGEEVRAIMPNMAFVASQHKVTRQAGIAQIGFLLGVILILFISVMASGGNVRRYFHSKSGVMNFAAMQVAVFQTSENYQLNSLPIFYRFYASNPHLLGIKGIAGAYNSLIVSDRGFGIFRSFWKIINIFNSHQQLFVYSGSAPNIFPLKAYPPSVRHVWRLSPGNQNFMDYQPRPFNLGQCALRNFSGFFCSTYVFTGDAVQNPSEPSGGETAERLEKRAINIDKSQGKRQEIAGEIICGAFLYGLLFWFARETYLTRKDPKNSSEKSDAKNSGNP